MPTPSKTELIDALREENSRVIVFTQNEEFVWDYLLNAKGRFNIGYNPLYWNRKENKKITLGSLSPGYKIGLRTGCSGNVGLDCSATDLIFTRNPFFPISKQDAVFKEDFHFPPIHFRAVRPIDFINQECAIKFNSLNSLIRFHDFLTLNSIEHSLESQDEKSIHLTKSSTKINPQKSILLDGPYCPEDLVSFQNCKEIIVNHEMAFHYPAFKIVKEILQIFDEIPESGLSESFLSFRMSVSPITIRKALEFLVLAGCLKRAYQNNDHITIHKGYYAAPDDVWKKIPEGTHAIKHLIRYLNVPRETIIPLLTHYEGKGINFSYVPKVDEDLYAYVKPLGQEEYGKAYQALAMQMTFMSGWIQGGDTFLNSYLNQKIEKHCQETSSQAVLFAVGQATRLNLQSTAIDGAQEIDAL